MIMTATERIEALLNCVNGTIKDVPRTYDEKTRKQIGDLLRKQTRSPYDEVAYLSNVIVRLEEALAFMVKRASEEDDGLDGQTFTDPEMADGSVFHGDAIEITDDIAAQLLAED